MHIKILLFILTACTSTYTQELITIRQIDSVSILFKTAKADISQTNQLVTHLKSLQIKPTDHILIKAYTDTTGSIESNKRLATKRLLSTLQLLKTNGIESQIDTLNEVGKPKNQLSLAEQRRVDIFITKTTNNVVYDKPVSLKINFEGGTDRLRTDSYAAINQLRDLLISDTTINIELHGHICCGIDKKNELSQSRAKRVADYLIRKGISKNRIAYKGLGNTKPLVPDTSEENNNLNRRVEVIFKLPIQVTK